MCLKYGKSQPKRAYKARAYKKKECDQIVFYIFPHLRCVTVDFVHLVICDVHLLDLHLQNSSGNTRLIWIK